MQELRASIGISGDPATIRATLLREFIGTDKACNIHVSLKDFAIPGDVVIEKGILVYAHVVRDEENLNNDVMVEFKAATETELFPTFRGVLDVYAAEYGSESVLEIVGAYEAPLGMLGLAIDSTIGYVIAQRSMTDFLSTVAERLHVATVAAPQPC